MERGAKAEYPEEGLLLEEELQLLMEMMEWGRLLPPFRCSNDDTAIEFLTLGTNNRRNSFRIKSHQRTLHDLKRFNQIAT